MLIMHDKWHHCVQKNLSRSLCPPIQVLHGAWWIINRFLYLHELRLSSASTSNPYLGLKVEEFGKQEIVINTKLYKK